MTDANAQVAAAVALAHPPQITVPEDGQVATDVVVEWDLDNDGDFDEPEEDITAQVLDLSYSTGRDFPSQLLGKSTAGRLRATVNNQTGPGYFGDSVYFNQFDTVGDASVLGSEWEVYDSDPGNAGFGVRSPDQVSVEADGSATSGSNVLRIRAQNTGGEHYHGGVKLLRPFQYGEAELRVRIDGDFDEKTSGVVIFWPTANQSIFPDSNNASGDEGEWPAGSELDFWETYDSRITRTPVEWNLHRLNPAATPPYDSSDDQKISGTYTGVDGRDWHKIQCRWTPEKISIIIDNGTEQVLTTDTGYIPEWPMELTIQLDAFSDTPPTVPILMDVDYVLLRPYVLEGRSNRFSYYNTDSDLNTDPFSLKSGRKIRVRTSESTPIDPVVLARDRMSGSGNIGSTENGLSWTTHGGLWNRSGGYLEAGQAGTSYATVDVGEQDYYVQARYQYNDVENATGILIQWEDSSNWELVYMTNGAIGYLSIESGAITNSFGWQVEVRADAAFSVEVIGTTGRVFIDGVLIGSIDLVSSTSTRVGIYANWNSQRPPRFDEFFVWDKMSGYYDGAIWSGTVSTVESSIDNRTGRKIAVITAEGELARLDREVNPPSTVGVSAGVSVGVDPGTLIGNVLGKVGALHPPHRLDRGAKVGAYGSDRVKAITAVRAFEEAEIGFVHERPEGGIGFDSRDARLYSSSVARFTTSPDTLADIHPESFRARNSQRDIVNRVTSRVSPGLPRLVNQYINPGNTAAAVANDVAFTVPTTANGATAGMLCVVVAVSTVQDDTVPWLNPTGWTNLRPTYDELGLTRIYAKRLEAGDLGQDVTIMDDVNSTGGAWISWVYLIDNWHGTVASGVSLAGPTGYGEPHTGTDAAAGTNDPPVMLTPWTPSASLYIAFRAGMAGSGATVGTFDNSSVPDGFFNASDYSIDATAGPAYDVAYQTAFRNDSSGVVNPSPFLGTFTGFDYVETGVIAVRPYAGETPPVTGGIKVVANNVASQADHGTIVEHRNPADILLNETAAAAYNDYLLTRYDQDRPIVTLGFHGNKTVNHRTQARLRRLSDKVTVINPDEGVSADFFIEAIRGRITEGNTRWWVEYDLSPALDAGGGADNVAVSVDDVDNPDPDPDPDPTPLTVDSTAQTVGTGGPRTVTNPVQNNGTSMLYVCIAPGPSESTSGSFTAPAGATQIFNDNGTGFVPRIRVWAGVDDGSANYTFGWSDAADHQSCYIIGLDGVADSYVVTSGLITGGATSIPYPEITDVQVDDLLLAMAAQQNTNEMTAGPSGWTEELDDTNNTPLRLAVHSYRSDSTSRTPGNSTWNSTSAGKTTWVIAAQGSSTSGGWSKIADGSWTVFIDPEDQTTWDENRSDGQLIVAGNRLQQGSSTDDINLGTGYGLSFDAAGEIHSFTMQDGDTMRLGARNVTGLYNTTKALITKGQWVNGNGYDESQETGGGQNPSTDISGTFASDWTYFDGSPRTQFAQIPTSASDPKAIAASFNQGDGDEFIMANIWRVEEWMLASGDTAGHEIHAPSGGTLSPYIEFWGGGTWKVVTRDQTTAWTSGQPPSTTHYTKTITAGNVGQWWGVVVRGQLDPLQGYLEVWLNTGSGFVKVVDIPDGTGWGWAWADGNSNNNIFYAMLGPRIYVWHRFTNDATNAPNNWDDTYGNVRTMASGWSGLIVAPSVTASDVMGHLNYYLLG